MNLTKLISNYNGDFLNDLMDIHPKEFVEFYLKQTRSKIDLMPSKKTEMRELILEKDYKTLENLMCENMELEVGELSSKPRTARLSDARHILIYVLTERGHFYTDIARYLKRHRTSMHHSYEKTKAAVRDGIKCYPIGRRDFLEWIEYFQKEMSNLEVENV